MKYLYIIIFFSLISCHSELPKDFTIKVDFDGEIYNSETETLVRYNTLKKNSIVKIELTKEQKLELYEFYQKIDFLSFPSEFQCDTLKPGGIIPSSSLEIQIKANGIIKGSRTNSHCDNKLEMEKEKKLYDFSNELKKMLEQNPIYKRIPSSDMIRL